MKKTLFILFILCSTISYGQKYQMYNTQNYHNQLRLNSATGEVYQIQDDGGKWLIVNDIEPNGEVPNRFKLYETENIWTFIELDTFTGRLWQVQFSTESVAYMIYVPINIVKLGDYNKSVFTISPMTSMFQYYLINEDTGEMWMFQWSTKGDDYRWIKPY